MIDSSSFWAYSVLISNFSDALLSAPDVKLGESEDTGKALIGLVVASLEEDHSSSVLPRLAWPNMESSLLQNNHL